MREEGATARRLPFEERAELCRLDRHQDKICLAGSVLARALADLLGGGEMDEAVGGVLGGAAVEACRFRRRPLVPAAHVVDPPSLHRARTLSPPRLDRQSG